MRAIDERTFSQTPVWVFLCLFCSDWPAARQWLTFEAPPSTRHETRKLQGRSRGFVRYLIVADTGGLFIGGAVIGFVVALLSRARSRVWVSLGGAFGTFFGMAGVLVGFAVLAAIFDIKSGGGHGGAQAGFLLLLLLGGPLGAIFGSLLVRKLTGRRKSPRGKE